MDQFFVLLVVDEDDTLLVDSNIALDGLDFGEDLAENSGPFLRGLDHHLLLVQDVVVEPVLQDFQVVMELLEVDIDLLDLFVEKPLAGEYRGVCLVLLVQGLLVDLLEE